MIDDPFLQTLLPTTHDLGGFKVHRTLPHRERTTIGPFIFFDQMGPATLAPGTGIDVRPHPHINLATVTYLFAGAIDHRDSLARRSAGRAVPYLARERHSPAPRTDPRRRSSPSSESGEVVVRATGNGVGVAGGLDHLEPHSVGIECHDHARRAARHG